MFEDLRSKLTTIYEDFHVVAYPTLPVNYPGRTAVDPENRMAPFVVMGIRFGKPKQLNLGQRDVRVKGDLILQYFFRPGTGAKQSTQYSDFLLDKISLRTISGIVFRELSPYTDAGMEGWDGTLNVIPFQIEYFNV
jgi:hypothetical protein